MSSRLIDTGKIVFAISPFLVTISAQNRNLDTASNMKYLSLVLSISLLATQTFSQEDPVELAEGFPAEEEIGELETTVVSSTPTRLKPNVRKSYTSSVVISDAEPITVPVISTATRTPKTNFEAPYIVDSLLSDELANRSVRSLPEAFEQTPGVLVQKTAHGQGSPFIRGFTAYHNLLLIDGIRLNNAVFRSGPNQYWNTVDSQGLSGIELVKSQGSVIYGSDAVGGTFRL